MQLIGLTGGIATGKSTVAKRMRALGVSVIDIDSVAKSVVSNQIPFLREHCPEAMSSGAIDRKVLARKLFSDAQFRRRLNALVHPRIVFHVLALLILNFLTGTQRVALDVPLLFETGVDQWMSLNVVVHTSRDVEMERLIKREGISREEAEERIDSQAPLEEKCRQATFILDNNGSVERLFDDVDELIRATKPSFLHWVYWLPIPLIVIFTLGQLLLRLR